MCVVFAKVEGENYCKRLRTKLKIATVVRNSVDFSSKMIMVDYFFVVQSHLTNNTSRTQINYSHTFFIRYYELFMFLFSLGNRLGTLSEPTKKTFRCISHLQNHNNHFHQLYQQHRNLLRKVSEFLF